MADRTRSPRSAGGDPPPAVRPSATSWLRRLEAGEVSARELVASTCERIAEADDRVHAVVAMDPEGAVAAATAADERRLRGDTAPLLGLPITVKDSLDVVGFTSTGGSLARARHRPRRDATAVARLKAAGAVVVAKTNLPEYSASYETDNVVHGRTNHPRDPERTPGGSSGGEAALLGADASIVGIGVDGGGSIRVPSHYCGIVGLRPTAGRIPETGHWPATRASGMLDFFSVGPMGRYVEDLDLLLRLIAGPDWVDPYAPPAPLGDPGTVRIDGLRVAVCEDDGLVAPSPETRAAVRSAGSALETRGSRVEPAQLPDLSAATELFFAVMGADGGAQMRRDVAAADGHHHAQFSALLRGLGERTPTAVEFFTLQQRVFELRAAYRRALSDVDVVISPVTSGPAPLHGEPPWGVAPARYLRYEAFNHCHAVSLAGLPSVVVPAGEQDGLPIGVQMIASPFADHVALAAAAQLDSSAGTPQHSPD